MKRENLERASLLMKNMVGIAKSINMLGGANKNLGLSIGFPGTGLDANEMVYLHIEGAEDSERVLNFVQGILEERYNSLEQELEQL